jgi:UDP-N-acetylmuramoylalanine--D-glutamate ligase
MKKRIVVLGGGVSGVGAAVLAKKKGFKVFLSEYGKITCQNKKILDDNNITWEQNGHSESKIFNANEVIKSPGIPNSAKIILKLRLAKIHIISEIEFAYRYTNAKIAAITGSNGKTTTTLILGHILKKAGYDVLIAGNIGVGFGLSIADRDYDFIVLEVSSFQLDDIEKFRSNISIILNISKDHLDRYENTFKNYIASKFKITKNQKESDILIYNSDDIQLQKIQTKAKKIPISFLHPQKNGGYIKDKKIKINLNNKTMTIQELALQGKHNMFNTMAAAIAARVFEVKDSVIRQSMLDFKNAEHRLEFVLTINGIDFINDSKATNVNASWFALESMHKKIVWIVGGVDKGNEYSDLLPLVNEKVKAIICLGDNNHNIMQSFQGKVDTIVQASTMKEAVNHSFNLADKGDAVLLSPACASFDLFENYEDRGLQFKNSVRLL